MAYMGKESKNLKKSGNISISIYKADSLCCTPETNKIF